MQSLRARDIRRPMLGFDPSSTAFGVAALLPGDAKPRLGVLRADPGNMLTRWHSLAIRAQRWARINAIPAGMPVAVEIYGGRGSPRTHLATMGAVSAVAAAMQVGEIIGPLHAQAARRAVFGRHISKAGVLREVSGALGLNITDHEADALVIALAGLSQQAKGAVEP